MTTVQLRAFADEEAMALRDLPDGWVWCEAAGWFYASPAREVGTEAFDPLGPFQTVAEMCAAVDAEDRRTRAEGDHNG